MKDFNVLITGCSKHSKGIVDCLKGNDDGVSVGVYGCDCNADNLLRESVDGGIIVPRIDNPNYIPSLIEYCHKNGINIIIPYITAELEMLSANKTRFNAEGIHVSISNLKSLAIANSKVELSKLFGAYMPKQAVCSDVHAIEDFCQKMSYPSQLVCCKIDGGCGGAGFAILDEAKSKDISLFNKTGVPRYIHIDELLSIVEERHTRVILQEYVQGIDYSVCVLADGKHNIHRQGYAGYAMQYGAVISGEIIDFENAYRIADEVTSKIGLEGNACFDFMVKPNGEAVLLEVNPRINASLPFVAAAGLNLPYLRCKQLLGEDISSPVSVQLGLKMQKYYECKYYV